MISNIERLAIILERDDEHFEIVKEQIAKLESKMKAMLLQQAEYEAHDWNRLDDLTYSFDGRARMKDIRNGKYFYDK